MTVPAGTIGYKGGVSTPVPSSGAISLGNFHGSSSVQRYSYTVTVTPTGVATGSLYTANSSKVPGYVAGETDVTFVFSGNNGPVYVPANGSGWAAGDTVAIINNGNIIGYAGVGGGGGIIATSGGTGIIVSRATTITNNVGCKIAGGGGGGAAGAWGTGNYNDGTKGGTGGPYYSRGGGGGGGAGAYGVSGGGAAGAPTSQSIVSPTDYYRTASAGSAGSYTAGGAGGLSDWGHMHNVSPDSYWQAGRGGDGGGLGQAGQGVGNPTFASNPKMYVAWASANVAGGSGQYLGGGPTATVTYGYYSYAGEYPFGGGTGGYAINGISNVTITNNGAVYGGYV